MGRLADRVAVVTGAAGGIGRAVAERFAAEGARVVAADLREPNPPLSQSIRTERLDVASDRAVKDSFERIAGEFGSLDVLANVAGVQVERDVVETTLDEFDWMLATNLRGVFICCRHAIPHMRARGGGVIVNIGSISGMFGDPRLAVYAATKGGVHALTRALTVDHGHEGIRCNAILPGGDQPDRAKQRLPQGSPARGLRLRRTTSARCTSSRRAPRRR
jgi:NAD(P)-dependent dehydrogenase (short-subunit alcohol dehydrogenase family)